VQGSFLHAGDGRIPVRYHVEETREGSSFSTRRVSVRQDGALLFVAIASFHQAEPGASYELPSPGATPGPDGIDYGRYNNPVFESRDVPPGAGPATPPLARRAWFRSRLPLPDDPVLHAQAVVYLSDYGATRGVRQPHADHPGLEQRMSVSLNHSVWLHSPARADDWLLSEYYPMATGAGRGLAFGSIRAADGRLVATLAQEALLRIPDPTEPAGD
jgi:acyl-CoA thioesterase-2